jgi:RHS repeat-associated protein
VANQDNFRGQPGGSPRARRAGELESEQQRTTTADSPLSIPPVALPVSLPKGGGAIRGIGERFATNPATGTGAMTVPLPVTSGRSGFTPQLVLTYDSASGNGPFGFGWSLSIPSITRKTDRGLPTYDDARESDVYVLSGAEDLVPVLDATGARHEDAVSTPGFTIHRYRPRLEGLFARIERWTDRSTGDIHWRSISRENVTTVYGQDDNSRIMTPSQPARIFSWLACSSYDDKGNASVYEYAAENDRSIASAQANERNRSRTANRYIKRVKYGNRVSRLVEPDLTSATWLFEIVFDYGEGHYLPTAAAPPGALQTVQVSAEGNGEWAARPDPFSSYRSGFEVRTYRRCQRMLMFHRFEELNQELEPELLDSPYLVRTFELDYSDLDYTDAPTVDSELAHHGSTRLVSFIQSITQSGFIRDDTVPIVNRDGLQYLTYAKSSLPALDLEYTKARIRDEIRELDASSLDDLPAGVDGRTYQWVDLDGDGLSGVLTAQAGAWSFKPNLGDGQLGRRQLLPTAPSQSGITDGGAQLLDLSGDGQLDVVSFGSPTPGFYERTLDSAWQPFRSFKRLPNLQWDAPNVRFIDLDGDGHADILITEHEVFTWHPSLAEDGFGAAVRIRVPQDEERGPRLILGDVVETIYLADLSGDGLTDLVRIRNGEVCYWPNLGYGRFGAKVTMDNAPRFDHPDQFDPSRIRLADIDGSGTTDIIYLGRDGARLYFNRSGNSWTGARPLSGFPISHDLATVETVDLLGNGTTCLIWSSALPTSRSLRLRYVDLMGGIKPHLLVRSVNNLGAETIVDYAPSTKFYLADKQHGRPWKTRLPFPVHVIERTVSRDHISGHRFVCTYSYHHGYFDGEEREFRGFGMVEQLDAEYFEDYVVGIRQSGGLQDDTRELSQPPITTRTWFHTGAVADRSGEPFSFRDEYNGNRQFLPAATLPADLSAGELRECMRALKGRPLRQEVYSFDGSSVENHPYSVVESCFEVHRLQRRGDARHGVFLVTSRESITLHYERDPDDPRISHKLSLDVDELGNVRKSCAISYPRRDVSDPSIPAETRNEQAKQFITYAETSYTEDIDTTGAASAYRLRVPFEVRNFEVTGIVPDGDQYEFEELLQKISSTTAIDYERIADGTPQRRLLDHSRILFLGNDLAPLPLGQWESLALPFRTLRLAFTPALAQLLSAMVGDADLAQAGYVHSEGDASWWIPSSTAVYAEDAAANFYLPRGSRTALGVETIATLDRYQLLVERVSVTQASWNTTSIQNDYRVLAPVSITDPNQNRTAVQFDARGMVVRTAVMGKAGAGEGDTLEDPTTRLEYELFNWVNHRTPNFVHAFAREQHGDANPRWQESFVYVNGGGNVAQSKTQAAPGRAIVVAPDGSVSEVDADPRWIGTGRTILNNKGKPVKKYEPYFSATSEYESERAVREMGVTPLWFYDAAGRNSRTLFPNGTLTRVEYSPWSIRSWDLNDTVRESRWFVERGSPDPGTTPEPLDDPERRAAWLAAAHADTPGVVHFDSLGRVTSAISDHGGGTTAMARSECDITGRTLKIFDPAGRETGRCFTAMGGVPVNSDDAEKGSRWTFQDVLGNMIKTWDSHGRSFRLDYDVLRRPTRAYVTEAGRAELLFSYVVHGDQVPDAIGRNLLGTAHQIFDQAGMMVVVALDFKGNATSIQRVLAADYANHPDWRHVAEQTSYDRIQAAAAEVLDLTEVFTASATYDALNRPTGVQLPDETNIVPAYDEANALSSLHAQIRGRGPVIEFLTHQAHNARGQRESVQFGNDVFTRHFYDPDSFRLSRLLTYRGTPDPGNRLQDLNYTFDPVGNVTQVNDDAQQTLFFANAVVKPENRFAYDAVYQLVRATGREHAALTNDQVGSSEDLPFVPQLPHVNDMNAVRNYTEEYEYDIHGNLKSVNHRLQGGAGWTRLYRYAYEDDPADRTNRLVASSAPGDAEGGPLGATYSYDAYGAMSRMPHLAGIEWNAFEQMSNVDLGGGGVVRHVYGVGGQRIRKILERPDGINLEWIFLGAVRIFRRRRRTTREIRLERWTVHISDDTDRIAQVDIKTIDVENADPDNAIDVPLVRYQFTNHLSSCVLETNEVGQPVSYEEYHPFGTTSYRSSRTGYNVSLKCYRFGGKERDDETGLYYFGARYYAAWLGRWTSADPAGLSAGLNLYRYCHNSPVSRTDPSGLDDSTRVDLPKGHPANQFRDPSKEAEAKAFLESVYTARLTDKSQKFVIDQMRFVKADRTWQVVKWHLEPNQDSSAADDGSGTGGDAAEDGPAATEPPAASETTTAPPSSGSGTSEADGEESTPARPDAATQAGPGVEKAIWGRSFRDRGFTLEHLYNNDIPNAITATGDNRPLYDVETNTHVKQIKSSNGGTGTLEAHASKATRDAGAAIRRNPTGTMSGKQPQAVVITPTDAPPTAGADIRRGYDNIRRPVPNSVPPEHVRGLPGAAGTVGRGLTFGGAGLSAVALGADLARGDYSMAVGDAFSTAGGALEVTAILSPGATVAGVSAMSAGLVLGGVGIAITSGISGVRAYQRGDYAGAAAGAVGVLAGLAIVAGMIFGAPALLIGGLIAALGVGLFHLGRWLFG